MIEVQNLKAGFGKKEILHDLNLSIQHNTITAIVGQSGCGKTTFLKTLNRILEEEGGYITGSIKIDGKDHKEMKTESLRKQVGMVFQQPVAFPYSIEKNLKLVLKYYGVKRKDELEKEMIKALKKAKLYDEVKDQMKMSAKRLSGGQKQRLAIARSLCASPKILLLDEPCSALDIKNTMAIEETLLELKKQYTIVIVTHNLSQAKRISDWVIHMDAGKIVEVTKSEEFFKKEMATLIG